MIRTEFRMAIALAVFLGVLSAGCGGGGETTQTTGVTSPSSSVLAWNPPMTYEDNTVMDPYRELDYYEIYVRSDDPNFTDNEVPVAQVKAVTDVLAPDGVTHNYELIKDFALSNLLPFTQQGVVYYLSIKSVAVDGLKSDFSQPVLWDLT